MKGRCLMKYNCIIFDSEKEFRKYLIQKSKSIKRLIIFEDNLDSMIFFYCFMNNKTIVASKEYSYKDFMIFKKDYIMLSNELHLIISVVQHQMIEFRKI